jgi:DNA polymerase-3 subunit delta'
MTLTAIKGHDSAIRMLESARRRGRLATSYLFAGEEGVGKRTTALAFAASLNCREPVDREGIRDACGECSSCVKTSSGTHPDLLVIEPDGAQIKVEQIRQVEEMLSYRSFEGGMKVVIVDTAEAMNQASANAFLKTLEEPAPESIIILVSSTPDRLPATIRSRCSRVNFSLLSDLDCREVLAAFEAAPTDTAVRLSMGRPGLAASEDLTAERDRFLDTLDMMLGGESKPPWKDRAEIERFLDSVMLLLRDMAAAKTDPDGLINSDLADEVGEMCARAGLEKILECYESIRKLRGTLFFNLNRGITWNYAASLLGELKIRG